MSKKMSAAQAKFFGGGKKPGKGLPGPGGKGGQAMPHPAARAAAQARFGTPPAMTHKETVLSSGMDPGTQVSHAKQLQNSNNIPDTTSGSKMHAAAKRRLGSAMVARQKGQ